MLFLKQGAFIPLSFDGGLTGIASLLPLLFRDEVTRLKGEG